MNVFTTSSKLNKENHHKKFVNPFKSMGKLVSNIIFPLKDLKRIQNFITMILFANERGGGCENFLTRVCYLFILDEPDFYMSYFFFVIHFFLDLAFVVPINRVRS